MKKQRIIALILSTIMFLCLMPKLEAKAEPNTTEATGLILPTEEELKEQKKKSVTLTEDNIKNYSNSKGQKGRAAVAVNTLPTSVDNSESDYFPEIKSQEQIGSCAAFAATYYNMTFATAKINDWKVKSNGKNIPSRVFSPKWSYNFVGSRQNDGIIYGSSQFNHFEFLKLHGGLTLDKVPYDYNNILNEMYNKSAKDDLWKEALKYKVDEIINISFQTRNEREGISSDTIVTNPNDENLKIAKEFLADGNLLTISSDTYNWSYDKKITGGSHKDELIFPTIYRNPNPSDNSTHALTVVGYDDDIWYDFNQNGIAEDCEKGAFKIANSWGTNFANDGFIWISYDALNKKTSVPNNKEDQKYKGHGFLSNYALGITAKPMPTSSEYENQRLLQFTLDHSVGSEVEVLLGYKSNTSEDIDDYYDMMLNDEQVKLKYPSDKTITSNSKKDTDKSFNGYSNDTVGVFTLDLSVLEKKYDIKLEDINKYLVTFIDKDKNNKKLKVTDLKITDGNGKVIKNSPVSLPLEIDGNFKTIEIDNKLGLETPINQLQKPNLELFSFDQHCIYDFTTGSVYVISPKNNNAKLACLYKDNILIGKKFIYYNLGKDKKDCFVFSNDIVSKGNHKYKAVLLNDTDSITSDILSVNRVGAYKTLLQTDSSTSNDGSYDLYFEVPKDSGVTDWSLFEDDNNKPIQSGKIDYTQVDSENMVKVKISGKSDIDLLHKYKVTLSGMYANAEDSNTVKIFNMDKFKDIYREDSSSNKYNKDADINNDGIFDIVDIVSISSGKVNKIDKVNPTLETSHYYSDKSYYDLKLKVDDPENIIKTVELYSDDELIDDDLDFKDDDKSKESKIKEINITGFDTRSLFHKYKVKITDIYERVSWSDEIEIFDLDKLESLKGTKSTSSNYNADVDVNNDKVIDSKDINIIKSW